MSTWITHLMVADGVLERFPTLDRRGFCAGSIAPDCNIENADWSDFTPPRRVTHWMHGANKSFSDCDAFLNRYLLSRAPDISSAQERAFLLGYYAHLIVDAAFQMMTRDEARVQAAWRRLCANETLRALSVNLEPGWDSLKQLVPKALRLREISQMEAEYLRDHPNSGYLTEILPLQSFPDYIDYLPTGCIVRKIGVMGNVPELSCEPFEFISYSREEYASFVSACIALVCEKIQPYIYS